jgi:hypothetical protein
MLRFPLALDPERKVMARMGLLTLAAAAAAASGSAAMVLQEAPEDLES